MDVSKFTEKFNRIEGNSYIHEEEVTVTNNVYNGQLEHDNINPKTLAVYTGPSLTGQKITNYFLSTPTLAPWKYKIRIYAENVEKLYISYTTDGDQVEAEDINNLQKEIIRTQEAVNTEENRAINKEIEIENNLNDEIERATNAENALNENLNNEINRATAKESEINTELLNRYKKDETFSKEEVLQKIADLVNSAPETLDTLEEIARALGNDPNFSTTIINLLAGKVDKEEGKGLSANDYTNVEKQKLEDLRNGKANYDLINGSLRIAQRYNANDTATFTNPSNKYIMDRFLCNGTGTVVPLVGGGCTITGTINFKYYMEKLDFNLLPEKFNITYSIDGVETVLEVIKADCTVDADGNGLIFDKDITDATLNYVHYGKGPFMPRKYVEELQACKRYYQRILALGIVIGYNINLPITYPVVMRTVPNVTIYDGYNRIVSDVYKNKINILGTGSVSVSPKLNSATNEVISTIQCNDSIASSGYALVLLVLDSDIYN